MKTKSEVKQSILAALGNPSSGIFLDYIDVIVDAAVGEEAKAIPSGFVPTGNTAASELAKETRVVGASEKR